MSAGRAAALGCAPHSGWAVVIAIGADASTPSVLARERIDMTDPGDLESKQPYHAVEDLPLDEAARRLRSFEASARTMAAEGLRRIVADLSKEGWRVTAVGILESSGRKAASLAATLASHALIHTADGDHFRGALADAGARHGLAVSRVRARDLEAEAATALRKSPEALRQALKEMGRAVGTPWGADQKAAALLAWLVVAARSRSRP